MQTKTTLKFALATLLGSLIALPAMADHNSVWGPGWANMTNDIHNTRIEDDLDQEEWTDYVQNGDATDDDNRYLDSDSTMGGSQR